MRALFRSANLIGDALYISPALRAWIKLYTKNKPSTQEDEIYLQTLPDHVAPLYAGMVRDLLTYTEMYDNAPPAQKSIFKFKTIFERPEGAFDFEHVFNVSVAFSVSDKKKQHLAYSYADLLGVDIGITSSSCKPIYIPEYTLANWYDDVPGMNYNSMFALKGCILISMFSASCESRDKNRKGLPPNKMLPFAKWLPMLKVIRERYPDVPVRFLGAPDDIIPNGYALDMVRPGEYMLGIPLNRLALIMQHARFVVTIDNGISHLAASQETPTFLMYPQCLSPTYILPIGNPNLAWMHMNPVTVNTRELVFKLEHAISKFEDQRKEKDAFTRTETM